MTGSCLGKIFISLNTLEKSGYAVSRYAITPLRGLLTTGDHICLEMSGYSVRFVQLASK